VVQRYGVDVNGGAESLCRDVAEHLAPVWDVEVLTSCSREYVHRFDNDYPEGPALENSIPVRRFRVDHLRAQERAFSALDQRVRARHSTSDEDDLWLREIGPHCSGLRRYVCEHAREFDLFVFFSYLYWTTNSILPHVKNRAVLVPTAHDEPPIVARPFDTLFALPRILLCSTPEEEAFLRRRSAGRLSPTRIVGSGMDPGGADDAALFRAHVGLSGQYVLYVGRVQREKGCHALFDHYLGLPEETKTTFPLVLVGKAAMQIPDSPHVRHVGFLSEELKRSALAGATLLLMPSPYESLSLVTLEAWRSGVPVLVNGESDVLEAQCRRSQGGLWYRDADEFREAFCLLVGDAALRGALGENGRTYVQRNHRWDAIVTKYQGVLDHVRGATAT
jgi:glycosyltransferase involved in cell wall biosynthesis